MIQFENAAFAHAEAGWLIEPICRTCDYNVLVSNSLALGEKYRSSCQVVIHPIEC
jgi:hypothetical protein